MKIGENTENIEKQNMVHFFKKLKQVQNLTKDCPQKGNNRQRTYLIINVKYSFDALSVYQLSTNNDVKFN